MTNIELLHEDPDASPDRHLTNWDVSYEGSSIAVEAFTSGTIAAEYRNSGHNPTELIRRHLDDLFADPSLDARRVGASLVLDLTRSDLDPFRA
jgi:hypothetical protein